MKKVLIVIAILLFVVSPIILAAGHWGFRWFVAPIEGKVQVQEQTHDAYFMMSAYDYFFEEYNTIKAYGDQIEIQRDLLNESCSQSFTERILTNIAGIEGQRILSIADYNGRAKESWTVGQFRDNNLPYQLEIEDGKLIEIYEEE